MVPGNYCNSDGSVQNIVFDGTQTVTFSPGVYFFIDATLSVQAGATLRCRTGGIDCQAPPNGAISTGVSLVFTGSNPA